MSPQGSLGLQWKLAIILLGGNLLGAGLVAGGFYLGSAIGMEPTAALAVGVAAGLAMGLLVAFAGFRVAREFKFRLWEAGDMAGRIAAGDFAARVPVGSPDEVGWVETQLNEMASHLQTAVRNLQGLAEQNRKLAEEAGRGAALEERARLARDLHDTVNQHLFVLAMRTAATRKRLEKLGGEAATLIPELAALEELAREAHAETRGLILQLRPTTLEQQGLAPALEEYVRAAAAREGWEAVVEADQAVRPEPAVAGNLFRLVQEALNNVSKHARAKTVWVSLSQTGAEIQVKVRDDGEGFDPRAGVRPTAVGLAGMQERVAAMGGSLRIRSAPGEGTEVAVLLPLPGGGEA